MAGVVSGMFLSALDQTIVATALPTLVESLGGFNQITWVFTIYMLASTVSAALWGKLSDIYGRRSTYLAAIAIFLVGSLLCAAAQNLPQLIAARAVQGIGGGGIGALAFTIMADVLSPRERGRYVGLLSGTFAAGSVIGPLLGGFIADNFGWQWIFLINLPLGLIALRISWSALRGVGTRRIARVDLRGAATLSTAIVCLLLAGVWGGDQYPWGSATIIGLLISSVVLAAVFVWIELRVDEPVIAPRLIRNRALVVSIVLAGFNTVVFQAPILYIPLFLQTVHVTSATGSGIAIVPLMVGMAVGSIVGGRQVSRTGHYKSLLLIGIAGMFVATAGFLGFDANTPSSSIIFWVGLMGLSFGCGAPVINLAAQNSMPAADIGAAGSALMTLRTLIGTLGLAAIGTIVLSSLRTSLAPTAEARQIDAQELVSGPKAIARLPAEVRQVVITAMTDAIRAGFILSLVVAAISFAVAIALPNVPLRSNVEELTVSH